MMGSKVIDILNTIADWVLLSILFVIGSLPVITIPTSFAAACHVMSRVLIGGKDSVIPEFFRAYKRHFKRITMMFLVNIAALLILIVPLYYLYPFYSELFIFQTYEISLFFLIMLNIAVGLRSLVLMAVKDMTWRESLCIAGSLMKNPVYSIILVLFTLLMLFVDILYPPMLCITPSLLAWVTLKTSSLAVKE